MVTTSEAGPIAPFTADSASSTAARSSKVIEFCSFRAISFWSLAMACCLCTSALLFFRSDWWHKGYTDTTDAHTHTHDVQVIHKRYTRDAHMKYRRYTWNTHEKQINYFGVILMSIMLARCVSPWAFDLVFCFHQWGLKPWCLWVMMQYNPEIPCDNIIYIHI